jgi:hypothetical protein
MTEPAADILELPLDLAQGALFAEFIQRPFLFA